MNPATRNLLWSFLESQGLCAESEADRESAPPPEWVMRFSAEDLLGKCNFGNGNLKNTEEWLSDNGLKLPFFAGDDPIGRAIWILNMRGYNVIKKPDV